jgi:ribosomal protein S18 acetylase RimI-like enzyme
MIKRLAPGEGALMRDLRLRALADAPYAFGSSLDEEAGYTTERWEAWAADPNGAVFVATSEGLAVGMAGGYMSNGMAHLWGMWVDPSARGRGLGRPLVERVLGWARDQNMTRIDLHITECPQTRAAAALYEKLGFTDTGEREPLESDPSLITRVLARGLEKGPR